MHILLKMHFQTLQRQSPSVNINNINAHKPAGQPMTKVTS